MPKNPLENLTDEHRFALAIVEMLHSLNMKKRIEFQKVAFLASRILAGLENLDMNVSSDFIPYNYGYFSEDMDESLQFLHDIGYIDQDNFALTDIGQEAFSELKAESPRALSKLSEIKKAFENLSAKDLIYATYRLYPESEERSQIADSVSSRVLDTVSFNIRNLADGTDIITNSEKGMKVRFRRDGKKVIVESL